MNEKRNIYGNRCSNPFSLPNHFVKTSLRKPSESEKLKCPQLTGRICILCRKRVDQLASSEAQSLESGQDHAISQDEIEIIEHDSPLEEVLSLPSKSSQESYHDIDSNLELINGSLVVLKQSPISKRHLSSETYINSKLRKLNASVKTKLGFEKQNVSKYIDKEANHFYEIVSKIKDQCCSPNLAYIEKIRILSLLPSDWSIRTISEKIDVSLHMARLSKKIHSVPNTSILPNKRGRSLSNETKELVIHFYEDDYISSLMPGKKDYVSVPNPEGKKVHVQKRLVLGNLKEIYAEFKKRNDNVKIGFSSFASLRPKHCILAGASGTHSTCVCSIHENFKLMIRGFGLYDLLKQSPWQVETYADFFQFLICDDPTYSCYLRTCESCPDSDILNDLLFNLIKENQIEKKYFKQWIAKPKVSLETVEMTAETFCKEFTQKAVALMKHHFIVKKQSEYFKMLQASLEDGEFIIQCDFSENYAFVVQNAVAGFHWNNSQATVYPVVLYYRADGVLQNRNLVIISDSLHHDAIAVYVFNRIIVKFLISICETPKKIYYISDGAPQQFKNFKNFVNLYYHEKDFKILAEWHFSPTSHGKGAPDGVGGTIKRLAARAINT